MDGQNKSCAYYCRALRTITKGLVGHLENIRANLENLDVAQIQKLPSYGSSTNAPTGSRLPRLQNVTCTGNWLPAEH